jgi:hypothetical protein
MSMQFMVTNHLTRFVSPTFNTFGLAEIARGDELEDYIKLIKKRNLSTLTEFQINKCTHFVVKRMGQVGPRPDLPRAPTYHAPRLTTHPDRHPGGCRHVRALREHQ